MSVMVGLNMRNWTSCSSPLGLHVPSPFGQCAPARKESPGGLVSVHHVLTKSQNLKIWRKKKTCEKTNESVLTVRRDANVITRTTTLQNNTPFYGNLKTKWRLSHGTYFVLLTIEHGLWSLSAAGRGASTWLSITIAVHTS